MTTTSLALKTSTKSKARSSDSDGSSVETTLKLFSHCADAATNTAARTQVSFSGASNCFTIKNEDKHALLFDFKTMEQTKEASKLQLLGFVGLFDGHAGEAASTYCRDGLLPHILAEMMAPQQKKNTGESQDHTLSTEETLKAAYTNAFEQAQERFTAGKRPPRLDDFLMGRSGSMRIGRVRRFFAGILPRQGGTTALAASLYLEGDQPFLFIANTGDCRLLIDDGTGSSNFRQITEDHRLTLVYERSRLRRAEQMGECELKHSQDALRIYPGGLAVSRTIGDCLHSKAVICTPEVYKVDLVEGKTYRLVFGSDGLWDSLSNSRVAQFAARHQLNEETQVEEEISAEAATVRIMKECLSNGGYVDDVTVIALDIKIERCPH